MNRFFCFLFLLTFSPIALRAVTISVSPSSISNQYPGLITFQIAGGLTNGESVIVEKIVDFNGNGTVEANEFTTQIYRLTDGGVSTIGGVTNINVPFDANPTGGTITANISTFLDDISRISGNYICRVSSPTGRFASASTTFQITNSVNAQTISGTVMSSSTNVANATVLALQETGDDERVVGGAFADGSGNFSLGLLPGDYILIATRNGYVFDFETAPFVSLSSSANASTNITLIPATRTISGRIVDLADTSKTLPGVAILLQSETALFAFAFTDGNGAFNIPVTANQWELELSEGHVEAAGYLNISENALPFLDTSGGNVSGFDVAVPKANALVYGYLKDQTNAPISGIGISADNDSLSNSAEGYSDANGYYTLGVLANNWWVGPFSEDLAAIGYGGAGTNVTLSAGQALRVDFTVQPFTAHLIGRVVDSSGTGVGDITIAASDWMGSWLPSTTDENGNFDIGVFGGTWHLQLESEGANERNIVGPDLTFTVSDGTNITNINYVVQNTTAQISGNVHGTNLNSIPFIHVFASATINGTNYNVNGETDSSGNYSLGVFNGTWSVGLSWDSLYDLGFEGPPNQDITISGSSGTVNFTVYPVQPLSITTTNLSNGAIDQTYGAGISAAGGRAPYNFSLGSGSLPPGLMLETWGGVSGTSTASGTFNFTVQVIDWAGNMASKDLSITIEGGSLPTAPHINYFRQLTNRDFELSFDGQPNGSYRIEASTTLLSTNWILLETITANPTDGSVYFRDTNAPSYNFRFYRAVAVP